MDDDINKGKPGNGTNKSGFNALPGGYRFYGAMFSGIGLDAHFWSSSEDYGEDAWQRSLSYNETNVDSTNQAKFCGLSVRCIKD